MSTPRQSSSSAIVIGINELETLQKRFAKLGEALGNSDDLVDMIGQQQADSAKRRIGETKRTPAGKRWKEWSEPYAQTRAAKHSLLVSTGALLDSITHTVVSPGEVMVGSNLAYAGAHLRGVPGKMPARPFLDTEGGFADPHDRAEIRDILRAVLRQAIK
jgi:phage virion morphogenesis protein